MAVPEIKDEKSLRAWLETRSPSEIVWIAERAALRVLPLVLDVDPGDFEKRTSEFQILHLMVFRANLLSSVARKYPTEDNRRAAARAARAALAAAYAADAADAAAYAARAAAYAADAAADAADAAADAADAARAARAAADAARAAADIWEQVRLDASVIESEKTDGRWPLFGNPVDDMFVAATAPIWHSAVLAGVAESSVFYASGEDGKWGVWLDAYKRKQANTNGPWFSEELDQQLAAKPDEWWEDRDPNEVVEEIAQIVGWPSGGGAVVNSPASVDPTWQDGRLTQSSVATSEFDRLDDALDGFSALETELSDLISDVPGNCDQRIVEFLRKTAELLSSGQFTKTQLVRLGLRLTTMLGYKASISEEWPDALVVRYDAICAEFPIALDRFQEWKDFERGIAESEIDGAGETLSEVTRVYVATKEGLEHRSLGSVVDQSLPAGMGQGLVIAESGEQLTDDARKALSVDRLESVSNILKQTNGPEDAARMIRQELDRATVIYQQSIIEHLPEAARKVGREEAEKLAKGMGRGATTAQAGSALIRVLKARFPKRFRWWSED